MSSLTRLISRLRRAAHPRRGIQPMHPLDAQFFELRRQRAAARAALTFEGPAS